MNRFIEAAFQRTRVTLMILMMIIAIGAICYRVIPKESAPEVKIPMVIVTTTLDGISPENSEDLLVDPLETKFASIDGLKKMTSEAFEGGANVTLEFNAGLDVDEALDDVREAVDEAKPDLPQDANDPIIQEVNTSLFPVITTILSGPVPERRLIKIAEDLKTELEALPGVLEVDIGGNREELLEILVEPNALETYQISFSELINTVHRNNSLIAAGSIETGNGKITLKVPGLIEDYEDVATLPLKVYDGVVVTFSDVASIRRTFVDPTGFARINGQPALALEVVKRSGENIIETVDATKATVYAAQEDWPESIRVDFLQDASKEVKDMLTDLEANVITAVALVMIVILWSLGTRSALLVGLAIPGAFLTGVSFIFLMGYTMNIVVLFALILVVGMLVDGAIVTTEYADRRLNEGVSPKEAYATAAKRMAWPIISSTATTLSVFIPLLFWDEVVGQFMKFLPITVLFTLGASLFMALIFIPVLGGAIGRKQPQSAAAMRVQEYSENGDPRDLDGFTGGYARVLNWSILHPGTTLVYAILFLIASFMVYGKLGNGVSFFPSVEPEYTQISIEARDGFSVHEKDKIIRAVEDVVAEEGAIKNAYSRTLSDAETIGRIQLELMPWDERRTADEISEDLKAKLADIPGIAVQIAAQQGGPGGGKPIVLSIFSEVRKDQQLATRMILDQMKAMGTFTDVTDPLPMPGVEWNLDVNRAEAVRYGADVTTLGQAVRLLTNGIQITDYRPDDADEAIDIRIRYPEADRTLEGLSKLKVPTPQGQVPIDNFVEIVPSEKVNSISRENQKRVLTIEADVTPGANVNEEVLKLTEVIEGLDLPASVEWKFGGEAEDQAAAMSFLIGAFVASIFMMFMILVTQFNSFRQAFIVMSAVVFSISGVLIGLLVTGRPFGIVMVGIGIIALAGIVVNNNIVLIDAFNELRSAGRSVKEAALRAGAQRLRPVLLTSVTTALGLLPMVIGLNINFFTREIVYGAPSSQWWTELSSAIAGGLVIATVLTLLVTPAMLVLTAKREKR